jgi:hypothetical protein
MVVYEMNIGVIDEVLSSIIAGEATNRRSGSHDHYSRVCVRDNCTPVF